MNKFFLPLAGTLAVLLAAEWLIPASPPPPPPLPAIQATAPQANNAAAIGQWTAAILARPLFNQNRRPQAIAQTNSDAPPPRLCAIIIAGNVRRAIFANLDGKPLLVSQGGAIGAYQLTAIAANSVTLLGPDGTTTLRPQYLVPPAQIAASGQ